MGIGSTPKGTDQQTKQYLMKLRQIAETAAATASEALELARKLSANQQAPTRPDTGGGASPGDAELSDALLATLMTVESRNASLWKLVAEIAGMLATHLAPQRKLERRVRELETAASFTYPR